MANEQNLTEAGRGWTVEEQSKGGQVSGQKRRLRAAVMRQLEMQLPKNGIKGVNKMLKEMGIDEDHRDYGTALAASMVYCGIRGNVSAAKWVRDTVGEKPTERMEVEQEYGPKTRDLLEGMSLEQKMAAVNSLKEEMFKPGGSE